MDRHWYTLDSGWKLLLESIHIQRFDVGFLEGKPKIIRKRVLKDLPARARKLCPGQTGLWIGPIPDDSAENPNHIFIGDFHCFEPVNPGADCSRMIACWFGDDLSTPLPELVATAIKSIDWEKYAVGGYY